ncbi:MULTISPECIES: LytTR family DNA-binding domain-containing protein [unclassified Sphingobacterium]|uniref:LytR/AlgR family response regulator transcription factor n=1 Tax=unclassified Sphingobacterium TaxID=2609468 RepID=UPI0020C48374|nr:MULTISPECIES: response regulator [unclassified Sphingobacterium]
MITKLRCLLLDDELPSLQYLKLLCQQIPDLEVVKSFNSPQDLLAEFPTLDFDLLISDIDMPGLNGLELAEQLRGKPIIFITAYAEYAADAFDLQAVDYIRKPLKIERLKQAIQKLLSIRGRKPIEEKNFVQLNTDQGKYLLYFDQIAYIQTSSLDSRDKIVRLVDQKEVTLKNISFDKLLEILPEMQFCRINKKEIISMNIISSFSHDEIKTNFSIGSDAPLTFNLSEIYKTAFIQKVSL